MARKGLAMLTTSKSKNPLNSSEMMFLRLLARAQFFRWVAQPFGLPRIAQAVLLLLTWNMSLQYRAKNVPKEPHRSQASMRAPMILCSMLNSSLLTCMQGYEKVLVDGRCGELGQVDLVPAHQLPPGVVTDVARAAVQRAQRQQQVVALVAQVKVKAGFEFHRGRAYACLRLKEE